MIAPRSLTQFVRTLTALAAALLSQSVAAQWLLASSATEFASGTRVEVLVAPPAGVSPPSRLAATLSVEGRRIRLTLERAESPDGGPPRYTVQLPSEYAGLATLELSELPSSRLLVQLVVPASLVTAIESKLGEPAADSGAPPSPSLLPNEPMYLLVGSSGNDRTARFQLSLKYRLFDSKGLAAGVLPAVQHFYFGYTQNSIWDLSGNSKPFRDTSYRPSLFYEWKTFGAESSQLSLRAGYEHESNGRDGADSRSIDTLFAKPTWKFNLEHGNFLEVSPKLWLYLDREDNPDIAHYRGYADLTLRAGDHQGLVGQLLVRRGTDGKGSGQLDLSYRLKRSLFADVGGFLHAQYFIGYGESILDYNRRQRPEFRLGFSIVR